MRSVRRADCAALPIMAAALLVHAAGGLVMLLVITTVTIFNLGTDSRSARIDLWWAASGIFL